MILERSYVTPKSCRRPNGISNDTIASMVAQLDKVGTRVLELPHGAIVYDVEGQNVCMTNCLTLDPKSDEIRQLIYCTDGHVRYDWRYPGALLF